MVLGSNDMLVGSFFVLLFDVSLLLSVFSVVLCAKSFLKLVSSKDFSSFKRLSCDCDFERERGGRSQIT